MSNANAHRWWNVTDIKPHLTRTFKLSNDKDFEPKFWDVIGLHLDPPNNALVFCCDEKSQCQALERTQPVLPLGKGQHPTRQAHPVRPLNYLDDRIIRLTAARHTHAE